MKYISCAVLLSVVGCRAGGVQSGAQPSSQPSVLLPAHQPDVAGGVSKPAVFASATMDKLVLRGAMREGTHYLANVEDTGTSRKIAWVGEGDLLTGDGARVTQVGLDRIVVEKNGSLRSIALGMRLDAGAQK